jgi:hypothetical protein
MALKDKLAEIDRLTKEVNDLEFYASTLEYSHQQSLKHEILMKADNLKQIAKQFESEINTGNYE